MATIYHVAGDWDGGDLVSLASRLDDGSLGLDLDQTLEMIANKWTDGDLRKAEEYLDADGHQVHCHATLADAVAYQEEWCDGGIILAIETVGLDVETGSRYPHPVVRQRIPAEAIRVA